MCNWNLDNVIDPKSECLHECLFSGYARVVLALASFYYMPTCYGLAVVFYLTSGLLDAFDGHAARMLNQCKNSRCILHHASLLSLKVIIQMSATDGYSCTTARNLNR